MLNLQYEKIYNHFFILLLISMNIPSRIYCIPKSINKHYHLFNNNGIIRVYSNASVYVTENFMVTPFSTLILSAFHFDKITPSQGM
jgi:hypothetical protein